MIRVLAHPNIALAKYWGKLAGPGNRPAMPSLSVTLAGMTTETRVSTIDAEDDRVIVNGRLVPAGGAAKARALLDRVRAEARLEARFSVESKNDFPTASGLASSASGFAALAVGARAAVGLPRDPTIESDLGRRASASAARSLFSGFVALPAGRADDGLLSAYPVAPATALPLVVLVAVTTEAEKEVSSSEGMRRTAEVGPYHAAWVAESTRLFGEIERAILTQDLSKVGELTERSALAMHASALAAGVLYFREATLSALRTVHALRAHGTGAWATMDAGPHVKVLAHANDADPVERALTGTPGVLRVLRATPGDGARIVSD